MLFIYLLTFSWFSLNSFLLFVTLKRMMIFSMKGINFFFKYSYTFIIKKPKHNSMYTVYIKILDECTISKKHFFLSLLDGNLKSHSVPPP